VLKLDAWNAQLSLCLVLFPDWTFGNKNHPAAILPPARSLRVVDIETLYQAALDPENVYDHLIGQQSALQVAHDLTNLDNHFPIEDG